MKSGRNFKSSNLPSKVSFINAHSPSKAWMRSRLLIISCGGKCPTLACRDVSVAGNKFGEDTTGGLNTEC